MVEVGSFISKKDHSFQAFIALYSQLFVLKR